MGRSIAANRSKSSDASLSGHGGRGAEK